MNEFKIVKEDGVYIMTVNIISPKKALLLNGALNSPKLQRRCLKSAIDVDYNIMDAKNDSIDFIITISGDVEGLNKVERVDKITQLLKSSIQTT